MFDIFLYPLFKLKAFDTTVPMYFAKSTTFRIRLFLQTMKFELGLVIRRIVLYLQRHHTTAHLLTFHAFSSPVAFDRRHSSGNTVPLNRLYKCFPEIEEHERSWLKNIYQ